MEYEECVCTNYHLERRKREPREIRVGLVEPKVRPSISRSHHSCSWACQTIDVVQHVGGEISNEFVNGVWKISPTLIRVPAFYSKEKQYKQGLCQFWITGESNFYWGKVHEMLKCLNFFLLLFHYIYVFIFFYDGKLGIMGNFAGWRNQRGCTKYVEFLPDGTYQSLNKDARVTVYS